MKVIAVVSVSLLTACAMPATAEHRNPFNDWGWADRAMSETHTRTRNTPRYRPGGEHHRRANHQSHHQPHHRPHGHVHSDRDRDELRHDTRCRADFQAAGDQALTEQGARDAAEKAFQQEIRFAYGELWADPSHAQDKTFLCVKSSVGGGLFHRCRMKAKPCMPEKLRQ